MAANPIPMPDDLGPIAPPEGVPALELPTTMAQPQARREQLYVVHWSYESGARGCGSPLPRLAAELMMLAYGARYADRRYWIEAATTDD